jgi:hypothetical protein
LFECLQAEGYRGPTTASSDMSGPGMPAPPRPSEPRLLSRCHSLLVRWLNSTGATNMWYSVASHRLSNWPISA